MRRRNMFDFVLRRAYCVLRNYKDIIAFCLIVAISLFVSGCGTSYSFKRQQASSEPIPAFESTKQLRVGERLTYEIRWMGIPVAIATLHVKETTQVQGKEAYHVVAGVKSNKFLSAIFRVDDEFHSYIQKDKFRTLKFVKRQAEGRYRSHEVVDYDYEAGIATYRSLLNGSEKTMSIETDLQDDFSAIYYFRMQDIKIGERIVMNVNADEKDWKVEAKVLHKGVMKLKRLGQFKAFIIEPTASTNGKKLKKGRIWIWFSADSRRIPLLARVRTPIVGTANAVLTKIE